MSLKVQHALVTNMAELMNRKFDEKRVKDTSNDEWWNKFIRGDESVEWLLMRLQEEVGEFIKWYREGNWYEAYRECGDISNFSALIAWVMMTNHVAARLVRYNAEDKAEAIMGKDVAHRYSEEP